MKRATFIVLDLSTCFRFPLNTGMASARC
jgi:hypothetical protein